MGKAITAVLTVGLLLAATGSANASSVGATAVLNNYIQAGNVTTNTSSLYSITSITYSLGPPEDNLATWDSQFTESPLGIRSDFLSNPRWFQTVTWAGLSIPPGGSFAFSNLDLDLIVTESPLNVTSMTLGGPETLRSGFLSATFSSGATAGAELIEQNWNLTQNLTLVEDSVVPEPVTILALMLSVGGLGGYVRRRVA